MSTSVRGAWTACCSQKTRIVTMSPIFVASLVILGSIFPLNAETNGRPEYIHCQTNLECSVGHCCTIGPIRYSIPQCKPMQTEGDICRPSSAETINMTVGYPDGAQVTLTDVHYILCPCADGLTCDGKEGVCKDIGEKRHSNRLFDEKEKRDD